MSGRSDSARYLAGQRSRRRRAPGRQAPARRRARQSAAAAAAGLPHHQSSSPARPFAAHQRHRSPSSSSPTSIVRSAARSSPCCRSCCIGTGDGSGWSTRTCRSTLYTEARGVSEAARCAGDQGRFWEFHDKVYARAVRWFAGHLQRYAQEAGVDVARFESCRASRTHQGAVERDVQEGGELGINGTPAFFINGRFLSGVAADRRLPADDRSGNRRRHPPRR